MRVNQRASFSDVQTSKMISFILNGSCESLCKGTSERQKWSILAELQRAKRASEAHWVRKIGYLSSRENVVKTSPYEHPSPVQTPGEGDRRLNIKLYRTLLKAVNIPIKYSFPISQFHFSTDRFFKNIQKKNKIILSGIYCLLRFFGCSQ